MKIPQLQISNILHQQANGSIRRLIFQPSIFLLFIHDLREPFLKNQKLIWTRRHFIFVEHPMLYICQKKKNLDGTIWNFYLASENVNSEFGQFNIRPLCGLIQLSTVIKINSGGSSNWRIIVIIGRFYRSTSRFLAHTSVGITSFFLFSDWLEAALIGAWCPGSPGIKILLFFSFTMGVFTWKRRRVNV